MNTIQTMNLSWGASDHSHVQSPHKTGNVYILLFNSSPPGQNGRHFADDTFKRNLLNENIRISIEISLKFVPKGSINNSR